jgi:hypothetical protein
MRDEIDDESEFGPDVSDESTVEKPPMPLRAKVCLTVGVLVLLAGLLVGFGIVDWYVSLWSTYPGWSSLLTAVIVLVPGLIFDRTRSVAGRILLVGVTLFVLYWMAVFSGYGWYVFFTTGLDIEGKFPLIISEPGGALIIAGIVMLIVCGCIHFMEGESLSCRAAVASAYAIMVTAFTLFILTMFSAPLLTPVATIGLTSDEISTLKGCEVTEGSTKVRCFLPEAAQEGSAR